MSSCTIERVVHALELPQALVEALNLARVRDRLRGPPERRGARLGQFHTFSWIEGPRRSTNFEHADDRLVDRHRPRAPAGALSRLTRNSRRLGQGLVVVAAPVLLVRRGPRDPKLGPLAVQSRGPVASNKLRGGRGVRAFE